MTAEKRILISLADIIPVGWECPHCHATYSIPMPAVDREVIAICPNCKERLMSETQPVSVKFSDSVLLKMALDFIRDLQQREIGKHLRFELGGDVKLDTKQ
jgi:uncharacterized paraquat-inducible protein A